MDVYVLYISYGMYDGGIDVAGIFSSEEKAHDDVCFISQHTVDEE